MWRWCWVRWIRLGPVSRVCGHDVTTTASNRGPLSRGYDLVAAILTINCCHSAPPREPGETFAATISTTSSSKTAFLDIPGSDIANHSDFNTIIFRFLSVFSFLICLASEHLFFQGKLSYQHIRQPGHRLLCFHIMAGLGGNLIAFTKQGQGLARYI